jgi:hypothetical protein
VIASRDPSASEFAAAASLQGGRLGMNSSVSETPLDDIQLVLLSRPDISGIKVVLQP